mmetsp:Transcript_17836/g.51060  ORF Transcript_17836/g.51060 Transcript_17836/m.51060 type:complete len:488 (+) Transcript_17836:51-1514(+)
MTGKKKGGGGSSRRRHGAESSSDDEKQPSEHTNDVSSAKAGDRDFAQRREAQRRAAADKRRARMKCHLCGESGHVRRECPGIADDGRGESCHKNAKGDKNARGRTSSKASDGSRKGGARNRGRKSSSKRYGEIRDLVLPPGFEAWSAATSKGNDGTRDDDDDDESPTPTPTPFAYFDAGCDPSATIEYLRSGRGKAKKSMREAAEEYEGTTSKTISDSNYGGCLARCAIEADRPWQPENATLINSHNASNTWFVLGSQNAAECDAGALSRAISSNKRRVVGVYADLDYRPTNLERKGMSADDQRSRLEATIRVAAEESMPIQIRTGPSPPSTSIEGGESSTSPYASAIVDLGKILLDNIRQYPTLKVHLSCWTGRSEHLTALLSAFPDNILVGFDATVTFAKATALHECVFDAPLAKILLETGSPRTIPSAVTKAQGREAFAHSGLVPFIADAIAAQKKTDTITAEKVARIASETFRKLYSPTFSDE